MSKALVHAFSDPKNHKPVRIPSFPGVNRTAVVGLEQTTTHSLGSGSKKRFILTRSPTAPLWVDTDISPTAHSTHVLKPSGSDWDSLLLLDIRDSWTGFISDTTTDITSSTAFSYIIGTDGQNDYAYLPQGCVPFCHIALTSGTHATASCFLDIIYYRKGSEFTDRVKLNRGGNVCTFPDSEKVPANVSWWRPGLLRLIDETNGVEQTFGVTVFNVGFCNTASSTRTAPLPLFVAPEFKTSRTPYGATRLTAVSVCLTNVTREFDKEGWATGYRIPTSALNPFLAMESVLPTVDSLCRYSGPLSKGVYTFVPPDDRSREFRRYHTDIVEEGTIAKPLFHLEDSEFSHIFFLADLDASDVTTIGVTLNWTIEFLTTSVLFPSAITPYTMDQMYEASRACAQMKYFHENPSHVSFMLAAANKALALAAPIVKNVGKAALNAAKQAAVKEVRKLVKPAKAKRGRKGKKNNPTPP